MNNDKVRMPTARTYRQIVPNDSVLFEKVLEALREPQLTAGVEAREAKARDQYCHSPPVDSQLTHASSGHTAAPAPFTLPTSPSLSALSTALQDTTPHRPEPVPSEEPNDVGIGPRRVKKMDPKTFTTTVHLSPKVDIRGLRRCRLSPLLGSATHPSRRRLRGSSG